MEYSIDESLQMIIEQRRELRIQRIDALLKEFDTLETMIDMNQSYVNLCYKYEQIFSLWVYVHKDFQPDELSKQEAMIWRLMPAILLCYKHYLIKKRENMDKDGINMSDRPVYNLRSLPKSSARSDLALIRQIGTKILRLLRLKKKDSSKESMTNFEKIRLSIKFENKLQKLSENELKLECKSLVKKFRKATAQFIHRHSTNELQLIPNKKKQKWIEQVKKLVTEIEKPSIIDNDVKHNLGDEDSRIQTEDNPTEDVIEDERINEIEISSKV
ncbi:6295_t:CDS:1 [Funneliformis mosseae]|uniref:6295_t:CDS:1 n=1 Tax=Funneliformis mosseae TaxID=27381 RepID=A0A9N9A8Z9_FUNMO|nr:6295_t:CDS:1 [Funneliformis mosseae]